MMMMTIIGDNDDGDDSYGNTIGIDGDDDDDDDDDDASFSLYD